MARLDYTQVMTGVEVPRREVLNARPWAIVKLSGLIIACFATAGLLLLGGAMLAGARINFHTPTVIPATPPSTPVAAPVATPALVFTPPPVTARIIPPALLAPTTLAPNSPEELERAFKGKLLTEGEDP